MASLIFSMASSNVSPWLWQPGSAGQCASYPYSLLLITTEYFIGLFSFVSFVIKKFFISDLYSIVLQCKNFFFL